MFCHAFLALFAFLFHACIISFFLWYSVLLTDLFFLGNFIYIYNSFAYFVLNSYPFPLSDFLVFCSSFFTLLFVLLFSIFKLFSYNFLNLLFKFRIIFHFLFKFSCIFFTNSSSSSFSYLIFPILKVFSPILFQLIVF